MASKRSTQLVAAIGLLCACPRAEPGASQQATPPDRRSSAESTAQGSPSPEPTALEAPQDTASDAAEPKLALDPASAGACPEHNAAEVGILVSPARVVRDEPVRILVATLADERPLAIRVEVEGKTLDVGPDTTFRASVPAATIVRLAKAPAEGFRVIVGRDGQGLACETVRVAARPVREEPRRALGTSVWPVERAWGPAEEALFSAWVRELFHAQRGEELAWAALHEATSVAGRNLLHDHYGWAEDAAPGQGGLFLQPDCADAPYFLRAYYAWKRQLPFGFRRCSRGQGKPPRCGELEAAWAPPKDAPDARLSGELGVVQRYFRRTLAWGVHSGNGRTPFESDATDYYPLALTRRALRPGTIFADPYGHLFVVVEMMSPQGSTPGVLYAIDGQPDGSITRKRFWEGNFLWNPDPSLGGSGFKGFRPLGEGAASNEEIAGMPGYGDFSLAQAQLTAPQFYDRMDALITPGARDPRVALQEAIVALHEAAKVRVTSVQNGDAFVAESPGTIPMPDGFKIFETTGSWENFSTPARDLRLLIAIDLVVEFATKVRRNAEVFVGPGTTLDAVVAQIDAERDALLADPKFAFTYTRSDGSSWSLTLADLVARSRSFEMGYNPNDCAEVRFGAPPKSEEASTCGRKAPADQRAKMEAYRVWFAERRRPARGDLGPPGAR